MNLLFYATDAKAAKAARDEAMRAKQPVRLLHVDACNEAEDLDDDDGLDFMPDVPAHDRKRILALHGRDVPEKSTAKNTAKIGQSGTPAA